MNYAFANPYGLGKTRRGGLLGIVLALHAAVLFLILAAKTVPPSLLESPLMVQFIEPPTPVEVAAAPRPLPLAAPKQALVQPRPPPVPPLKKHAPQPHIDTPVLETTASSDPAP